MRIHKQEDGSNRIELDDGECVYVQKGIDPIDGLIDIKIMQQKTAAYIMNPPIVFEDFFMPETFFYALSRTYYKHVCANQQNEDWYISTINDFNIEILKQQKLREGSGSFTNMDSDNKSENIGVAKDGKYKICLMDTLPELLSKPNEAAEDNEYSDETHQYIIAFTLLRFIYSGIDIRKIETRISELKGYCAFLEITTPDEFRAYCALIERTGFESEMDIEMYYELLNSIKKGSKW